MLWPLFGAVCGAAAVSLALAFSTDSLLLAARCVQFQEPGGTLLRMDQPPTVKNASDPIVAMDLSNVMDVEEGSHRLPPAAEYPMASDMSAAAAAAEVEQELHGRRVFQL